MEGAAEAAASADASDWANTGLRAADASGALMLDAGYHRTTTTTATSGARAAAPASSSKAKGAISLNLSSSSSAAAAAPAGRSGAKNAFGMGDEEDEEKRKLARPLIPLDYTAEEQSAALVSAAVSAGMRGGKGIGNIEEDDDDGPAGPAAGTQQQQKQPLQSAAAMKAIEQARAIAAALSKQHTTAATTTTTSTSTAAGKATDTAGSSSSSSAPAGGAADKKARLKAIVDAIPTDKDRLFAYPLRWEDVEAHQVGTGPESGRAVASRCISTAFHCAALSSSKTASSSYTAW